MKVKLNDTMNGKICLVTGATNGIGKATARALAQMGATVVMVGRDAHKAAEVTEEIRAASGNPNATGCWPIYLRSRKSGAWQTSS